MKPPVKSVIDFAKGFIFRSIQFLDLEVSGLPEHSKSSGDDRVCMLVSENGDDACDVHCSIERIRDLQSILVEASFILSGAGSFFSLEPKLGKLMFSVSFGFLILEGELCKFEFTKQLGFSVLGVKLCALVFGFFQPQQNTGEGLVLLQDEGVLIGVFVDVLELRSSRLNQFSNLSGIFRF